MKPYVNELKAYLAHHSPNFAYYNAHTLLDMLYNCYVRYNPTKSSTIDHGFAELAQHLQDLPLVDNDAVSDIVCSLCTEHEHLAFIEGIHVGMRLFSELEQQ